MSEMSKGKLAKDTLMGGGVFCAQYYQKRNYQHPGFTKTIIRTELVLCINISIMVLFDR